MKRFEDNGQMPRLVIAVGILIMGLGSPADVCAQVSHQRSISGEATADALESAQTRSKSKFLMNADGLGLGIRPRIDLEYNSNVYRVKKGEEKDDIIIRPEVKFDFYRPITDINSIDVTLGVGVDLYTKNTSINTYAPIISPDSEIAYHMFLGDAHIKLREAFSYQEDISVNAYYLQDMGAEYLDLDSVRFGRYDNKLGAMAEWDTGTFLFRGNFDWEWFHSNNSRYEYLDRNSGLFSQSVTYLLSPMLQTGLEFAEPVHFMEHGRFSDSLRVDAGPFVELRIDEHFSVKAGGGYSYVRFLSEYNTWAEDGTAVHWRTDDINDWYAYGSFSYFPVKWLGNTLTASRRNKLSWNSDNLEEVSVFDTIRVQYIRDFNIDLSGGVGFHKETGWQYVGCEDAGYLYPARPDAKSHYYSGGVGIAYTHWHNFEPSIRYSYYTYKREHSDSARSNYDVHRVMLGVQYTF